MTISNAAPVTDIPMQNASPIDAPLKTAGQNIHKWGSYLAVDWVINTAVGVGFAYFGKHTELGQALWSQPVTKTFEFVLSPLIKDQAQLAKSAEYGNMFASIIAGGMATVFMIDKLENKESKKHIVQAIDKQIYGEDKVAHNPQLRMAYDAMEREPKQDFNIAMAARAAALAPLLAIVLIPATKKIANAGLFNHVEHASEWAANKMGLTAESLSHVPPAKAQEQWKFIHESIAMDFGLGLPYAGLHAFFCGKFAQMMHKDKESITLKKHEMPPPEAIRQTAAVHDIPPQHTVAKTLPIHPTHHITEMSSAPERIAIQPPLQRAV